MATSLVAVVATLAAAPTASAALSAVGPVDPTTNFPSWYQDSSGLQLQPCLDGPPACFSTPADLVAPDGEFFYNNASAVVGDANIVLALEGAYAGRGTGQEIVFSRIRFFNKTGLVPGADYTVTHPYGTDVYTADVDGAILGKNATEDIGCLTPPCAGSFGMANSSRLGPFITWNTFGAATGAPPAGYVGDGVTPHRIAPVANGVDYFRVEGPNINKTRSNWCPGRTGDISCIQTNLFSVEGKVIAGPAAVVNPDAIDFGHQQAGTTSAARTVTLISRGASAVQVGAATIGGANPEDYTIGADTCSTVAVAPGTSCTVEVTFHPTAARASTATLTIPDDTPAGSHVVTLKGTTAPAATLDATSMDFPSQKVTTTSTPQVITVSNTGSADLVINAPAITGTNASSYRVADNTCTAAIPPKGSCTVSVAFAPTATGMLTATLNVSDNGPSTHTVALSGAGIAPTQTLSRSTIGFPDQPVNVTSGQSTVTLTNTGTAPLTMQNVSISGVNASDFALGTNTCAAGFEVVPNDGCSIGVTFRPSTNGSRGATLTVTSDARTTTVPLSGNGVTPPDTVAPSAPTAVKATAAGAGEIDLSWTAATDNVGVVRYDVYRDNGATPIGSATTPAYSDTTVAEASSHSYTVKAVDAAGNVSLPSAAASARTPDVTAPSAPGGVTATGASTTSIRVAWSAPTDNVGVTGYRIYRDGGATAVGSPTTTSFTDTVTSGTHTYQVAAIDAAGNLSAKSAVVSGSTTTDPAPTVSTTTPANAATAVPVGSDITATFSEVVQGVGTGTFTVRPTSGTTAVAAGVTRNGTTNQWILNPSADLAGNTSYTVTLTGGATAIRDSANQPLPATSWTFTTASGDTTAPTMTASSPASGATGVAIGTTTTRTPITATFSENVTGVSGTTFTLKQGTTAVAAAVTYNATTRVATLTPSAPLVTDRTYTATLTTGVRDAAGNALATKSWNFITGTRPTVTAKTPTAGATGVSAAGNVTVTFSEAVSGVSGTTLTLKNAAGTVVPAAVTYNATTRVATLDPTANLANDTKYTATATGGPTAIRDAAGNTLSSTGASWTFTTGPRPTVTARTPGVNALNVGRTANVTATFSEAVTGTTTAGTVTLKNATTGVVQTAVVTYNATTRVVTLNPSATLAANTKFTATLSAGIKDAAGNPITATTWSFTTGAV